MNAMRCSALCLIAGLFVAVPVVHAQTLADVAKKEQERRQSVKDGKSYSNKDLKEGPPPNIVSSSSDAKAADAKPADAKPADPKAAAAKPADGKAADATPAAANTEEGWRKRMTTLREALDRDKIMAEALQSRVNALTTDFVNRDDPAQRSIIEADRKRALSELERTRKAIDDGVKAIQALEEEARKANVPAGWLR